MGTSVTNSPTPQTQSPAITDAANTNVAAPAGKQTPVQPQKPPEDPQAAANAAKASKQNAAERKTQQDMQGQLVQKNLYKQVPTADKKAGAPQTNASTGASESLPKQARVIMRGLRSQYDFGRPITKEQAARLIFKDGKVPNEAKLVQGPGNNSWTVVTTDMDAHQATVNKRRAHTETWDTSKPGEFTVIWSDGPSKASTGPKRHDLQNDFGFKIFRNYKLDEVQRPTGQLGQPGHGYEVSFEKPMTRDQVMDKLIDKKKITHGEVKLVPIGREPAMLWKVEVIGIDALGGFKHPVDRAFKDANLYAKESLPSGTSAGIRTHFENKTIPTDAVKHPPNTYVWEQDGHMAYVQKTPDGGYHFQFTKLPTDPQGLNWMRYYMKEQGMAPREAWKNFWNDTIEVTRMQVGVIGGTGRTPRMPKVAPRGRPTVTNSPSTGGRVTTTKPSVKVDIPNVTQKPKTDIGHAKTQPQQGPPPPVQKPNVRPSTAPDSTPPAPQAQPNQPTKLGKSTGPRASSIPADNERIRINTPNGPKEMTAGEYRRRVNDAKKWMAEQRIKLNLKQGDPGPTELYKQAQQRFGLDNGWNRVGNPIVSGKI